MNGPTLDTNLGAAPIGGGTKSRLQEFKDKARHGLNFLKTKHSNLNSLSKTATVNGTAAATAAAAIPWLLGVPVLGQVGAIAAGVGSIAHLGYRHFFSTEKREAINEGITSAFRRGTDKVLGADMSVNALRSDLRSAAVRGISENKDEILNILQGLTVNTVSRVSFFKDGTKENRGVIQTFDKLLRSSDNEVRNAAIAVLREVAVIDNRVDATRVNTVIGYNSSDDESVRTTSAYDLIIAANSFQRSELHKVLDNHSSSHLLTHHLLGLGADFGNTAFTDDVSNIYNWALSGEGTKPAGIGNVRQIRTIALTDMQSIDKTKDKLKFRTITVDTAEMQASGINSGSGRVGGKSFEFSIEGLRKSLTSTDDTSKIMNKFFAAYRVLEYRKTQALMIRGLAARAEVEDAKEQQALLLGILSNPKILDADGILNTRLKTHINDNPDEMAEHIARIQNESFAPLQEHHAQKAITSWNTAMSGTRPELVITVTAPETNHSALLNFRNQTEANSQNNINTVMSEINSNIGTDNPNFAALKDKLNNLNSSISSDRAISTVIQNNPQILNQLNSTNTADHYLALISLEEAMTAATTPHNTIFMDTSRAMIYRTIGASSNLNLAAMTSTHVIENYSAIVNLDGLETFVEQTKNSIGVLKNPQRITFNTILNDPSNASILTNLQSDNQAKKQLGAFQLYQAIESHTDKVKLHNYLEKNIAPPRGEKVRRTDGRYTINWNPTELATVNTISIKDLLDKTAEASRIVAKLDKFTKEVDAELTQTLGPDLARVINKLTIEENQPTENVARINSLETSINNVRESTKPSNPTASQTSFSKFLDNLLNAIFEAIKGKYAAKA